MFARSAAMDTFQGKAIQAVNQLWGDHDKANWSAGRESIGIPVCKKKYRPFLFRLETEAATGSSESTAETENADANSASPVVAAAAAAASAASDSGKKSATSNQVRVVVKRMYACQCHHELRKKMIEQHGLRKGWEPFGQWSMRKAQDLAKREEKRIQQQLLDEDGDNSDLEEVSSSSDEASQNFCSLINTNAATVAAIGPPLSLHGGRSCTAGSSLLWKVKSAHDDIYKEIHGFSEAEDNNDP